MTYPKRDTSESAIVRVPAFGPDFICIGMARAGTGWLFHQLLYHPDFWLPPVKELAYLKQDTPALRGDAKKRYKRLKAGVDNRWKKVLSYANRRPDDRRDLEFLEEVRAGAGEPLRMDRYAALFRFKEDALSGDITPGYCTLPEERIAQLGAQLPHTKIILLVRDPVDRAWSRICMWFRRGIVKSEVLENPATFGAFINSEKFNRESFPTRVLERWKRAAPASPLRYYLFDDIAREPDRARQEILGFLGADPDKTSGELGAGYNKKGSSDKLELTPDKKAALVTHFREELLACAEVFGGEARNWKSRYDI